MDQTSNCSTVHVITRVNTNNQNHEHGHVHSSWGGTPPLNRVETGFTPQSNHYCSTPQDSHIRHTFSRQQPMLHLETTLSIRELCLHLQMMQSLAWFHVAFGLA